MVYEKYLIVVNKYDRASFNIYLQLKEIGKFDFHVIGKEMIYTENLDLDLISKYDFIIFASKHQSEKQMKTLSVHPVGNWKNADYGGEKGKVGRSSALFMKMLFENLNKYAKKAKLNEYAVSLESTHHGPLIDKPSVFIEIGSTDEEWSDVRAAKVLAETISETIKNFKENPYNEVAIGIGGPHYCPGFNKIQNGSNFAISHILPEYALPLTEEMLDEAIKKTEEKIDLVMLDWKGMGKSEDRQKIIDMLNKKYINFKRTSEIK